MSIVKYPLQDVGFLITPYVAAYINLSVDTQQNYVPDSIKAILSQFDILAKNNQLPDDSKYYDLTFTGDNMPDSINDAYYEGFDGQCRSLFPQKSKTPLNITYYDDNLLYIPLSKRTYASEEEILTEIQTLFQQHSIKMPETLDWWKHIVTITGRYLC